MKKIEEILYAAVGVSCLDVAVIGEVPMPNNLALLANYSTRLGGPALANAYAALQLGAKVRCVGPVGNDMFAAEMVRMMKLGGMDVSCLTPLDGVGGSWSFILADPKNGERRIFHYPGHNEWLTPERISDRALDGVQGLLVAGLGITKGLHGYPAEKLLKSAKHENLMTCVDTCDTGNSQPSESAWMIVPTLKWVDLFCVSMAEASQFTGRTDPSAVAHTLIGGGAKNVMVKCGDKGMVVCTKDGEPIQIPAFVVKNPKDTTGCGDAAVAACYTRMLQGDSIEEAAHFASAVGALVAMKGEGVHGVPSEARVLEFMQNTPRST